jgi:predicted SprT family Zn-dependent metalloprotease
MEKCFENGYKTTVAEYLEACGLVDQVLDGIDKITTNDDYKETAVNALSTWTMAKITKSVRTAGQCCYYDRKIKLHIELLKAGREIDRNDTLLHEIGHMLVKFFWGKILSRAPKAHGREWKHVTSLIGGVPERCHDYSYFADLRMAKAKHKYVCMDCGWEHFTQRALKNMDKRHHSGCTKKPNGGRLTHTVLGR